MGKLSHENTCVDERDRERKILFAIAMQRWAAVIQTVIKFLNTRCRRHW
jgi:hypothetical protein